MEEAFSKIKFNMKYKFYVMMNNNNNDNNTSPYTNKNKHNNRPPSLSCIYIDL